MGKILILKNADFSANAIKMVNFTGEDEPVGDTYFDLDGNMMFIDTDLKGNKALGRGTFLLNFGDVMGTLKKSRMDLWQFLLFAGTPGDQTYCLRFGNSANSGLLAYIVDNTKYFTESYLFTNYKEDSVQSIILSDAVYLFDADGNKTKVNFPSLQTYNLQSEVMANGKFVVNGQSIGGNGYINTINTINSQESFDDAISNAKMIPSINSYGHLKNLIYIPEAHYDNVEDILANRANALIDIVVDSNGVPTNQGSGGGNVYYTKN